MSRPPKPCTETSPCASCRRPVLWVQWESGKLMPVDAQPAASGNVVIAMRGGLYGKLVAESFDAERHIGRRRYASHFATCPHADQHRRPTQATLRFEGASR